MTSELPVFRLGFGGFSPSQQQVIVDAIQKSAAGSKQWIVGDDLAEADAWWMNGARVQVLGDQRVRVGAGNPGGKSIQLYLPDIDRPVAFSVPVAVSTFRPNYTFDPTSAASMTEVLGKVDAWLAPQSVQFRLASYIAERQRDLGGDVFDVYLRGSIIAVVDMRGDIGVSPTLGAEGLEQSFWQKREHAVIPEHFARTSMSMLMWHYGTRTQRDLLPRHYRVGPLYFRRPPRIAQRLIRDSHLLMLREMAREPVSFPALLKRTGWTEVFLSQTLAALYLVGAITSSPKRAAPHLRPVRPEGVSVQGPPSDLSTFDSVPPSLPPQLAHRPPDMTAPAPLRIN